jgi:SAM-dependent methyltransferase
LSHRADRRVPSWEPLGRALLDYHHGDHRAGFVVHSDLWDDEYTAAAEYYRPDHRPLPEIERRALALCRGRVLDLGAGAGRHALELQHRNIPVTAVDISSQAVEVMRDRGVSDARCGDLSAVAGEKFQTILLLMHGIGLVGTLAGLDEFLGAASGFLRDDGQVVFDSADLEAVMPGIAERRRPRGGAHRGYFGEVEFRLSYRDLEGRPYPWLFIDPATLAHVATGAGFAGETVTRGSRGAYLARLKRQQ